MTLSLDPSLTAFGYAVFDSSNNYITGNCITTSKQKGKVSDSDAERVLEIATELHTVCLKYNIDRIISESPAGSKSSQAIKALSLVKGMIIGVSLNFANVEWLSAGDVRKSILSNRLASKDEVLSHVKTTIHNFPQKLTKEKTYAISDACAVYLATI